ncbi:MAG: hypothetical protein R3F43_10840 [bacterium]
MSRPARPSTIDILDQIANDFIRRDLALHYTDDTPSTVASSPSRGAS